MVATHCPSAEVGTSRSPEGWSQPWSSWSSWVEIIGVVGKAGVNMAKPNHKHVFLKHVFLKHVLCVFLGGFYLVDVSNMFNATLPA